jgi:branched-chain amino acid transport system permease protein
MSLVIQMLYNGLVIASVYILLAVGFNLVWGILGIVNFAHGHFFMLGAFFAWFFLVTMGFNFYAALVASSLCILVLAAGTLKGLLEPLRQDLHTCAMIAMGLAFLIEGAAMALFGGEARIVPMPITGVARFGGAVFSYARLVTLAFSLVIFGVFMFLVYFTRFGRALRAVGDDAEIAATQGINVSAIGFWVFCIATVLAGAGGVLASYMTPLMPSMGFDFSLKAFIVIVVGGFGSIAGAVVGALLIGLIESFIGTIFNPVIAVIVSFALVLLIFMVRPSGLLGQPGKIP